MTASYLTPLFCFQSLQSELTRLEKEVFDAYIAQKAESLVGNLEPGMTAGDFRWYDCLPPNGNCTWKLASKLI